MLIFNVVYVFNEFPFVSILINNPDLATVSLAVSKFQGQYTVDYGGMMAAATLVLLPQLVIYALPATRHRRPDRGRGQGLVLKVQQGPVVMLELISAPRQMVRADVSQQERHA